ncbi:hypothetical protein PHISCL_05830 [Aspergillus sclerotialis]|uniref:C6 finger domain protein n=1 Tax=Aspergillus sclerotialis TaxID=2070753 RepID=A0A3A2ZFS3_9EURO|nr:hypothetical protein PHISCL_05830 [Aspergillus sclerotialis]
MLRGEKAFPRRRNQRGSSRLPHAVGSGDGDASSSQNSPGSLVSTTETVKTRGSDQIAQPTSTKAQSPLQRLLPQSIPYSPYLPLEDTVIPLFINSFLYVPKDPQTTNGFMDLLPQSYSNTKFGSHLHLATLAVSFFSVAAWTGQRSLLRSSELFFLKALPKTREALQYGIRDNLEEILMTVLLLSTYEEFYAMKDSNRPARTHLRGAVALVNSRRPEQSNSPSSEILTRAVQIQIIRHSTGLSYPSIPTPNLWPIFAPMAPNAPSQLAVAASQLVNLRLEWEGLTSDNAQPPSQSSISDILSKANSFDANLSTWAGNAPAHWAPIPASSIPESVRTACAGLYQNRCDCYPDLWVASVWNLYRDTRIAALNIILTCLRLLSTQNSTNPNFIANDNDNAIQSTLTTIHSLATDICGTVPFFIGSQTSPVLFNTNIVQYPEAEGRTVTSAHKQTAPLLGGWYVITYLAHISVPGLGLDEEMLRWIRGQMGRVLRIYGFGAQQGRDISGSSMGNSVKVG